ncbi:MAG: peptide-methionine (R)-S-oxide reductase [Alphaproteobacteria bacterium]|nr:MAG: peptide-methionine (R)-S-oxide reductase [Alphaproteobacteria bacterium]
MEKLQLTDQQWKERLTDEQYRVMRGHGTEAAFCSELHPENREGAYHCAACDLPLFSSKDKFLSKSGWPSFTRAVTPDAIEQNVDRSWGMVRTEIHCGRCDGHLGHVFEDGPAPTGLRHCLNGVALQFVANESTD